MAIEPNDLYQSFDGEYIYNIFSRSPDQMTVSVDILNKDLEAIASRNWGVEDFQKQIESGTIIKYRETV